METSAKCEAVAALARQLRAAEAPTTAYASFAAGAQSFDWDPKAMTLVMSTHKVIIQLCNNYHLYNLLTTYLAHSDLLADCGADILTHLKE